MQTCPLNARRLRELGCKSFTFRKIQRFKLILNLLIQADAEVRKLITYVEITEACPVSFRQFLGKRGRHYLKNPVESSRTSNREIKLRNIIGGDYEY